MSAVVWGSQTALLPRGFRREGTGFQGLCVSRDWATGWKSLCAGEDILWLAGDKLLEY